MVDKKRIRKIIAEALNYIQDVEINIFNNLEKIYNIFCNPNYQNCHKKKQKKLNNPISIK